MPLIFAGVWGKTASNVSAVARATADDRAAGYQLEGSPPGGFMPFAMPETAYWDMVRNGPDNYSYNGSVAMGADGIREVHMYPWKWKSASGELGLRDRATSGFLTLAGPTTAPQPWYRRSMAAPPPVN